MYAKKAFSTNLVWKANSKSLTEQDFSQRTFWAGWDFCTPSFSPYPNSNQITAKKRGFFKRLTCQELVVHRFQIFSWLSTFLPYEVPPRINELRVEVTTNSLAKMQYISLFDWIDIVLDQWPNKDKEINARLPYYSQ